MHRYLHHLSKRWLYSLLGMIAWTILGQAAQPMPASGAANRGMSTLQRQRMLVMPPFSPSSSVNLGMLPLLCTYGGMAQPMQTGRANRYASGVPYAGSTGYGGSQGSAHGEDRGWATPPSSQGYAAEPQPSTEEKSLRSLLRLSGVPSENGRISWPLGLRILAARETDVLREQIDILFQAAASQAAGGPVNAVLIQEMERAVTTFRRLLLKDKAERFGMPLAVYNESERFLKQLGQATQLLKAGLQLPGEYDRQMTTTPSTSYPSRGTTR